MGRLEQIVPEEMSDEQRRFFEAIVESRHLQYNLDQRERLYREGLRGPFNAWAYAPSLGMLAQALGASLRFAGQLTDRQREIAILCVAAHWRSDFEWWAHARIAEQCGLEPAVVESIFAGTPPVLADESERLVYECARSLLREHRLDAPLYGELARAFGEAELVELVTLLGYYVMISMTLNAFEVEVPPGETPPFNAG